ncbi:3-oxoacyl-ACP synthase III family protein [Azospirillum soli]|uniref:3-oxoacyl-ACP synthase III family protein n=1 Tax=Azospirillum soli TaxID=1304799 RepID=UPI001AE3A525|nr:ketoacyl-ACP synthase III [Azospirillum soli]MBP2316232.1 3-oxoacyl-[acyl-carrier-protein] synthase-3 [Azospirillum soli]
MVKAVIEDVRIAGMRAVVPRQRHSFMEDHSLFSAEEAEKLYATTGVRERRIAPPHICASDLCVAAGEGLLRQLDWDPQTVDVLIFVSQDADYNVPATACIMQKRLGLGNGAACFDVNLGCSGFVYGLWLAGRLLGGSTGRRALVLCGDISSRHLVPGDRSTRPLFGDAGGAAALEVVPGAAPMHVVVGTDGAGAKNIWVKAGGRRNALTPGLVERTPEEQAQLFNDSRLSLNGAEVFAFTLRAVPPLVREVLEFAQTTVDALDHCVMHQANAFMLEHLRKKVKIPDEKFLTDMHDFGNTSSASIPLAISHRLGESLATGTRRMLLAGFGVGWSWGALIGDVGPIPPPEVAELPDDFSVLTP